MVETLLVMGLLAAMAVAIFSTLAGGFKIWKRGYQSVVEEDLLIFFDKLTDDLHNAFEFSKVPLEGKADSFSFATMVRTPADAQSALAGEYVDQIGKVEYYFDGTQKTVLRRQANYSQALQNKFSPARQLVTDVQSLKFRYYYQKTKQLPWHQQTSQRLPSAVEVTVHFGAEKHPQGMVKLISIPVGS